MLFSKFSILIRIDIYRYNIDIYRYNILSDEQIDDYLSEQVLPPIMEYAGNDDDGDDEPGGTWVKDVPTPVVLMCVWLHRLTHILDSNKRRNRLISGHVCAAF